MYLQYWSLQINSYLYEIIISTVPHTQTLEDKLINDNSQNKGLKNHCQLINVIIMLVMKAKEVMSDVRGGRTLTGQISGFGSRSVNGNMHFFTRC